MIESRIRTKPGRSRPPSALLRAALAAIVLLAACSGGSGTGSGDNPMAPNFTLEDVDGNRVRLSDFRGQVVVLHFWATWCAPCRAAISHENHWQERYKQRGFTVLGLNMDKNREDVVQFLSRNEVNYPVLYLDEETRKAFGGVPSIPLTILIDRHGRIRRTAMGYTHQLVRSLEKTIEALLREGPQQPLGS